MSTIAKDEEPRDGAGHSAVPDPARELQTSLDLVRQTALDLLDSLPSRPERLRLSAAGVSVDVDWRPPAGGPGSGSIAQAVPGGPLITPVNPLVGSGASADQATDQSLADPGLDLHYICAPSVGTFYCAPEPGAAPFVVEGSTVGLGQPVAIIEAMKLMLPVEADGTGRVVEVLVKDGQTVEFGERIIALAPTGTS